MRSSHRSLRFLALPAFALCALAYGAAVAPSAVSAQGVTFQFEAEVIAVSDNASLELAGQGGVAIGDVVTGFWSYDSGSPDLDPGDPRHGLYAGVTPVHAMSAVVNGISFGSDPSGVQMTVEVTNDAVVTGTHRDELRVVSTGNSIPVGFSAAPEFIGALFGDAVSLPERSPEFVVAAGDAIPTAIFRVTENLDPGPRLGWNDVQEFRISEFDPAGPLAGTGYSIVARMVSLEVCPTVDAAHDASVGIAKTEVASNLTTAQGVRIVHYTAGTTVADLEPGGVGYPDPSALIAWVEVRDLQLAGDLFVNGIAPEDCVFRSIIGTDDATNPAPPLVTLDLDSVPGNGPSFAGTAASWTIDLFDGTNAPGVLGGTRAHTLLYGRTGSAIPAICEVEETATAVDGGGAVTRTRIRSVLHFGDGVLHDPSGPEIDLVRGLAFGGSDFDTPIPGHAPVRPYLTRDSEWLLDGHVDRATAPHFFSGTETITLPLDQAVTVWVSAPCHADTIGMVAANRLGLTTSPSGGALQPGDTVEVELRMGGVEASTGFAAFLEFDAAQLSFVSGSYTGSPFPLHIGNPIVASGGQIDLDGSVSLGGSPVAGNALLATLTFNVVASPVEGETSIGFRDVSPFESTLSYLGDEVATALEDAPPIKIDATAPIVTPSPILTVSTDLGLCSATFDLPLPPTTDGCEIDTLIAVRSDGLALDDPYPGGCAGALFTGVTWTVTDCAGNFAQGSQLIEVVDGEAPILSCPDLAVPADPGGCTATPTIALPFVVDNCTVAPAVTFTRSDNPTALLTDPFPVGITEILWEATDDCGNTGTCVQEVEVLDQNSFSLDLELPGVSLVVPIVRCIQFTVRDAAGCVTPLSLPVSFSGTPATGTASFDFPCGSWIEVCAKDEQHTLHDSTPVTIAGGELVGVLPLTLVGGDTDNDGEIDLDDVFFLLAEFGQFSAVGSCPWSGTAVRDADFSLDGVVGSEDYAILTSSWLVATSCTCGGAPVTSPNPLYSPTGSAGRGGGRGSGGGGGGGGSGGSGALGGSLVENAPTGVSLPPHIRSQLDLDGNGQLDHRDVRLFELRYGLPHDLSDRLARS